MVLKLRKVVNHLRKNNMAKKRKKKIKVVSGVIKTTPTIEVKSEKVILLELYQTLKDLNIRRISDLENLIARAE